MRYTKKHYMHEQTKKGYKVELEHKKTLKRLMGRKISLKTAVKQIAKTHLKENPKYYAKVKFGKKWKEQMISRRK